MVSVHKILCPLDFSGHSRAALEHAEWLARTFDAELVVAHVVEPILYPVAYGLPASASVGNLEEEARQGAESALASVVEEIAGRGLRATSVVASGTPSMRICTLVKEHAIDLVVMATHGITGVKHLLIGSTTERVVRRCPCPILTVKAQPDHDGD